MASAPGNETVRLHRIAVQPEDGKPGDMITMQTPLRIEVDYWNLLPAVHLHATLHIYNDQGIIAFTTGPPLTRILCFTSSRRPAYFAASATSQATC